MKVRYMMSVCPILLAVCLVLGSIATSAQEQEHAVSPSQLRTDVQKSAAARQANEAEVREMIFRRIDADYQSEPETIRWRRGIASGGKSAMGLNGRV